tara:strand:- start:253 stop:633 length:381 start_codon:yes stop_codon:yes gene_type:complete
MKEINNMRMSYKKGKDVKKKSSFGMLSVKAGIDKNPNPTQADRIAGAKMGDRKKAMGGGMMRRTFKKGGSGKDTHVTKDGRTVKKGLYYYMNRAKKKGTSKPGKGSVTDKALKASAKTAKKPTKKA